MKKAARYIAAILATIQLSAIVSCGENGTRTPETSAGESDATTTDAETRNPLDDDVPALDFGGKELHVRSVTYETGSYLTLFDVEEQTGDVVFDALYKRNRLIEDRFNMKFVSDEASYLENIDLLKSLVMSGDASYDLIQCLNRDAFSVGLDGYLMPMESLTYLDLSKPYYGYKRAALYQRKAALRLQRRVLPDVRVGAHSDLQQAHDGRFRADLPV